MIWLYVLIAYILIGYIANLIAYLRYRIKNKLKIKFWQIVVTFLAFPIMFLTLPFELFSLADENRSYRRRLSEAIGHLKTFTNMAREELERRNGTQKGPETSA